MGLSRRFLTFLLFGGTAALVNLGVGWLIYRGHVVTMPYPAAVAVGAAAGLLVNFGLNYRFNFRFRERSAMAQLRTFTTISVIGIGLTAGLSFLFTALLPFEKLSLAGLSASREFSAHILAVGLVTFYSYAAHSYFTFNVGLRARSRQAFHAKVNP